MKRELEIYIHTPFCVKKCDYCDFFSEVSNDTKKNDYIEALLSEIKATEVAEEYRVVSIFFGGGTPSVLKASLIVEIMETLKVRFDIAGDVEITIECNPGTVDEDKLTAYRDCGINRISFGLQSTNDDELASLGRIHTYEEFLESYKLAKQVGFGNISVDLMSGLPGQTVSSWVKALEKIGDLSPPHISAYSLIVEEGTPFAARSLNLPSEDEEREIYEKTAEILTGFGYHQ